MISLSKKPHLKASIKQLNYRHPLQMVGGNGTKLLNLIARSKIDLPNVCFKNVKSAFV
jgi:hypothetical protein